MSKWRELTIPETGYILEFTFPEKDRMLVRTVDGLFVLSLEKLKLKQAMSAEEIDILDNGDSWGTEMSQTLHYDGDEWFFHGAESGDVTLCDLSSGERIECSDDGLELLILDADRDIVVQRIDFVLAADPDDFSIAGFSYDEKYLVLCKNDRLRVFESPHL